MENSGHNVIEYQQLKSFIVQIVAISLCKLWIFTLTFSKKTYILKLFPLQDAGVLQTQNPGRMPWAMSFCPLPFRFAPVTVGSGRKADRKRIYPFRA